ncbi:22458_t:CDS:2 [Racocetra persica]|uniref:22458_t:CDS:1 n=1 Tax=Racocetra persica TaxID=160502 RepID=A0ACA9P196_9GLOM|nr:22458_t:CDS:2 [Racocetra persica]
MQASTNKRKEENVVTQNAQPTETKLSRQTRTHKNKKLRCNQKQAEMLHELDVDIPLLINDIIFDPSRELVQFKYIAEPECITDLSSRTLVHLEQLNDYNAIILATNAVNNYYFHTLEHLSYRSDEFWTNFIKHFRAYTRNNLLPFTSFNTANYYKDLYTKLSRLSWGSFAPKPFGVFLMIAINFNTTSDYHWDEHDKANSLCVLVVLEDYEGGELCFPQFQIVIHLRPGQIVVFASRLLLHGNFSDFTKAYIKARIKKGANRPMVSEQDLNNA